MISHDDKQSCATFAVGYRAALVNLDPAQRAVMLKALADPTPGLATFLLQDYRNRQIALLADVSGEFSLNGKAEWVSRKLADYAAGAWIADSRDGIPATAGEIRRLLFDILSANGGRPIRSRQIYTILRDGMAVKT